MASKNEKPILKIGADASDAKKELNDLKQVFRDTGKEINGTQAKPFKDLPKDTQAALEPTTRQINAFSNLIKRTAAEATTYGKGQAERLERLAEFKFGDVPKQLAAQIDALRAYEQASVKSLTNVGTSAKATAAAMRQVPAQFTDIVVSLQGGQNPLTVLLQQGGQLKDIFGGAGTAAKALGSYILGLVNPFTVAAAAVGTIGYAYYAGSQEAKEYSKALILSGEAAGVTADKIGTMAANMAKLNGTQGQAAEALVAFISAGAAGSANLERFAASALAFSKATGTSVEDIAKQFSDLKRAPLEASLKLNESANYLTKTLYEQIKALEEQGRTTEAAALAQNAWADALDNRTPKMVENLGWIEKSYKGATQWVAGLWDAAKNIGRDQTIGQQIADLEATAKAKEAYIAKIGKDTAAGKFQQEGLDAVNAQLANLRETAKLSGVVARNREAEAAQVKAMSEYNKLVAKNLTDKQKLEKDILELRNKGIVAVVSEAQIEKDIAALKAARAKAPAKVTNPFAEEQGKLYAKSIEDFEKAELKAQVQMDGLTASQGHLVELLMNPAFQAMPETWKQTVLQFAYAAIAQEQLAQEVKDTAKATEEAEKSRLNDVESLRKQAAELEQQTAKQLLHNATIGKTADEIGKLTAQRELDNAAILEATAIKELDHNYDMEKYEATMKVVRAMREKAKAESEGGRLQAIQDEAKKAEAEWKRVSDEINRALTDSLMRAFEGGESFAAAFGKTVEAMFKTMVLRPIVSAVMNPVSQVVSSALTGVGIPGATSAAGSAATSAASTGASVFGATGSAFSAGLSLGAEGFSAGLEMMSSATGVSSFMAGAGQAAGSAFAAAGPYVLGAVALKALTDYTVDAKGNYLLANASGSGLSGQVARRDDYQQNSSGIFSGGTTQNSDWSRAGESIDAYFDAAIKSSTSAARQYATALGLPAEALDGYAKQIEVSITGLDAAGQKAAIDKAVSQFAVDMVDAAFGATISSLSKEGETSAQTLERLATNLTAVNIAFDKLGLAVQPVTAEAAATASALVEAFGGLDKAATSFSAYYDKFYSDSEKAAKATEALGKEFDKLGLEVPGTEAEFRALVESIDLTTESGRTLAAAVMSLAPAFDTAAQAAKQAASNMLSAIQNWGTSADVRNFKAQQLQQVLAAGGLTVGMDTLLGATKDSVLSYYNSLEANSPIRQLLLDNQQAIYDLVTGGQSSTVTGSDTSGYSSGGSSAGATAADNIASAWQAITDSIWGEVKRIRGLLEGTGTEALAAAQARFTVATAQARAGDQAAAEALPDLSKNLLLLAEANAKTLVELKTIQGQTSGSLAETGTLLALRYGLTIPKFAQGTNYTQEGLAYLHEGEAVVPAAYNPVAGGMDQSELIAEVRALRRQVAELQSAANATAKATASTAKTLDTVTEGGRAMQTEAYT